MIEQTTAADERTPSSGWFIALLAGITIALLVTLSGGGQPAPQACEATMAAPVVAEYIDADWTVLVVRP